MKNKVLILGTGTSTGVPVIGCHCEVCESSDPKNQRMRCSLLLQTSSGIKILIDASTDLRTQALKNKVDKIDAVIFTHDHADHTHGVDDLRPFCFGPPQKEIPTYTSSICAESLRSRFPYIFKTNEVFSKNKPILGGGIPRLKLMEVPEGVEVKIFDESFFFFLLPHGHTQTLAVIHQKLAYLVDCKSIPDKVIDFLTNRGVELLIIDCLKSQAHQTHLSVNESFDYIEKITPKRAGLIHMTHDLEHTKLSQLAEKRFGSGVFPLYDGQILEY